MQSAKPPRPKPPNWPAQSPQTVLLRNLQLLELDQEDYGPGAITLRTLSPSSQNQRQRMKAIEWVLYQLVALWDPDTARDKLRPFFPPLEPLQSVNLRAALFRVLSDLKKNGDLGRETILRKSMLDDCKGEKFDELLAVFSTVVVRKKATKQRTPAMDLCLASGLTPQEYTLLLPLILAHRASLATLGEHRDRLRDTHEKFSQLLDRKKEELASRPPIDKRVAVGQSADLEALARETKTNWQGSVEWADALLYGGLHSGHDAFLELPFDSAWSQAKQSTVDDLRATASRPDLVIDLESRVLRQRARLQRWRQYGASLKRSESLSPSTAPGANQQTLPLVFRDHQTLTVASISRAVRQPVDRAAAPSTKHQALLQSISEAMDRINGPSPKRPQESPVITPSLEDPEVELEPVPNPLSPIPTIHAPESIKELDRFEPRKETSLPREPTLPDSPIDDPTHAQGNRYTLVERTRKSMSLVPPPREHHHHHHHHPRPRPRQSRMSFPVNQFDTPPKPAHPPLSDSPSRASTPRDELFDEQADYASVFKSRPRIALSPVTSPAVHVSPIGDFDLSADLDPEAAEDMDMDMAGVGVGSPLASRRRRTMRF
ncbi:hypothetical protein ARAM_006626 [Aspergillus rambellii]|uniref:HAUS augmin-like complex subunit 6 N-terminal domain-containing protein n=1 Tax=Aspergillus rambellii TaxID=308745 RepID=A0A0F8V7Y3_9EURO|nr:hypothetical protein ARAM_006626 [Aspergillus rambellii]